MRFSAGLALGVAVIAATGLAAGSAAAQRKTPYYASIAASRALMRTGPARTYPANWLYQRADLPIKVVEVYKDWRKVEDPGGIQGWMQVTLLSDTRSAIVMGAVTELRDRPSTSASVRWRVEPGVVGRISKCDAAWCWLNVRGRGGYVERSHIWGLDPSETIP
jgi:SH3-like domain-containing protein